MDNTSKHAYLSPATGTLDISVIRDARPYVLISLDLGIPNFTVFSLKFPLVEDKPNSMSELVAEGVHTLLDEMSAFMISTNYLQEVIVQIYAAVLACFKSLTGEADTNKSMSPISKDPTVKTFEGTFKLPISFINETQDKVVTAAGKTIQRPPVHRHLELTYDKPAKTNVNDARTVIRNYRGRSLKTQPNPMYIIVYDMMGKARGTIPLGGNFKNDLLKAIYKKKAAHTPEFSPTVKFNSDIELKMTNVEGIPKSIFVAEKQFTPTAFISDDMALYAGEDEWLVKFPDGRVVPFEEHPEVEMLKEHNYPMPTIYTRWTLLPDEAVPESSDKAEAVDEQGNEVVEPTETDTPVVTELMPDDQKEKTSALDPKSKKGDFFRDCDTPQGRGQTRRAADHKDENGHWVGAGNAASGVLPICTSTGRIALAWRSSKVQEGDCWGTIGGAIKEGLSPAENAKVELAEEVGYEDDITLIPTFVYQDGKFKYHNFLGLVPSEFRMNPKPGGGNKMKFKDENDAMAWWSWKDLKNQIEVAPEEFHPGVLSLLNNSGDQIGEICGVASNRTEEGEDAAYSS